MGVLAQAPLGSNGSPPSQLLKRAASQTPLPEESPAKKQSKWTPEEDNLTIELRGLGMKWDDIAKRLPGRSSISCRLRYQNYLEKRAVWDEEKKNKLARLYARFKDQMWQKVATEMGIPWRSAESMHWQLGEQEMSARANAPVFQLHPSATSTASPPSSTVVPAPVPALGLVPTTNGFTPTNAIQLMPRPPGASTQLPALSAAPGSLHDYQVQMESAPNQPRRRHSSLYGRRQRTPPQFISAIPQAQAQSEADLISGALSAPSSALNPGIKREIDPGTFGEPFSKKRQAEETRSDRLSDLDQEKSPGAESQGRSPHSVSVTGKRLKTGKSPRQDDAEEMGRASPERSPTTL